MSRCRFVHAFDHHNMTPGPAGTAVPQVIWKTEDGIMDAYGTTVPTGAGYATGCLFRKTDGGDATSLYVNEGNATTADFNVVTVEA